MAVWPQGVQSTELSFVQKALNGFPGDWIQIFTCNLSQRRVTIKIEVYNFCSCLCTSINPGFKFWWWTITRSSAQMDTECELYRVSTHSQCEMSHWRTGHENSCSISGVAEPYDLLLTIFTQCFTLQAFFWKKAWTTDMGLLCTFFLTACLFICEN